MRIPILCLCLFLSAVPGYADESSDSAWRAGLRQRIEGLLQTTKTITWYQDVWSTNGKDDENTSADCFWTAPDKVRLNVKKGRGSGATAVYTSGKVTGFKPGMFSFVKLTYDVRDKAVLGIRGTDIRSNGWLDDFNLIVAQWATVQIDKGAQLALHYKNAEGLATTLWLAEQNLAPSKIESVENGKVVERFEYKNVVYNATIDAKLFNP